ncbi:MAG TPA: TolC family protein [Verrucomicrobiae bacterium]|nr:TolC family protein [Verrucomicrobiae bacterium]
MMNSHLEKDDEGEQRLVKLYMELTGSCESAARSVFMHTCGLEPDPSRPAPVPLTQPISNGEPGKRPGQGGLVPILLFGIAAWQALPAAAAPSTTPPPEHTLITTPLSLADAVNLALTQNPSIQRARKDIEAAQGVAIQTRAIALPTIGINGSYSDAQRSDIDSFQGPGFTFGTTENWVSQLKLVQSIYEGGRILSSLRAARLTRQQSMLNYQTTVADTVLNVELAYFDVLMAAQQITVQEASVELLTRELTDTNRRFEAGTVPRFNVLRAEVELANARPKLINARNSLRISKNNLANLLGFNIPRETFQEIPLNLSGRLEADPFELELTRALNLALERRTELGSLRKAQALRKEDLVTAKAGYKPSLQGFVGYDTHNSVLSQDLGAELHGWIAGAQLTWNLFDGLRTQGRILEATANYERAEVDLDDTTRRIELEVRTAYSNFIEAREVLESQKKVVEEAEEALRLARAREQAGTGTQLDVLSAQTALTDARSTQIQALHDYDAARARLQRAAGLNLPE